MRFRGAPHKGGFAKPPLEPRAGFEGELASLIRGVGGEHEAKANRYHPYSDGVEVDGRCGEEVAL
jgi:hypothetical protein